MAIYRFSTSEYATAAQKAADILEASGYFDSVSLSDNTVSCTKNNEVLATIAYTGGSITWAFGKFNQDVQAVTSFDIAVCSGGIYIGCTNSNILYCFALSHSENGKLMFTYRNGRDTENNTVTYAEDTAIELPKYTQSGNASSTQYAALYCACAPNGNEDYVSVSATVFLFAVTLSGLSTTYFQHIRIGDTRYLTDGNVCIKDEEG